MKLKEMKDKLNPKVALIGGAIVLTTTLGTCEFVYDEAAEPVTQEPIEEEAAPADDEQPEAAPEEEPAEAVAE